MGNLEKAGIAVVVVLLGVILVVAFVGDPGDTSGGQTANGQAAASETSPPGRGSPGSDRLAAHRDVEGADPKNTVHTSALREIKDVSGTGRKPPADDSARSRSAGASDPVVKDGAKDPGPGEPVNPPGRPVEPTPGSGAKSVSPAETNAAGFPKEARLADGDNLWKLVAREYGVTLTDVMLKRVLAVNGIRDAKRIKAGTTVKLPAPPEQAPKGTPGSDTAAREAPVSDHRAGGTPTGSNPPAVSARTSVKSKTSGLLPFDPGPLNFLPDSSRSSRGAGSDYVVKSGETLVQIARRELGSDRYVKEIADLNRIKDVNKVIAGTKLRLPSR